MTRPCLSVLAAIYIRWRAREGAAILDDRNCSFFVLSASSSALQRQPSAAMETMTSSFPLSTRGENDVQLDRVIFYSGPKSAKTRKSPPSDADQWLDVDVILAEAAQQKWVAGIEGSDPAGGFDIIGEGEPCSQCPHGGLPSNA